MVRRASAMLVAAWLASFGGVATAASVAADRQVSAVKDDKPSTPLPISAFAADPIIAAPAISPSGDALLGRVVRNGRAVPATLDLRTGRLMSYNLPASTSLRWMRWLKADVFLVSLGFQAYLFDVPVPASRLLAVKLGSSETKVLSLQGGGFSGDNVVFADPAGEFVLLSMQRSVYDPPSVFRVEVASGKAREVQKPKEGVGVWVADASGVIRAGLGGTDRRATLWYRPDGNAPFRKIEQLKLGDNKDADQRLSQLILAPGSDEGFVLSNQGTGRYALYRYNYGTRTFGEQVFAAPANDVDDVAFTPDNRSVRAAWWSDDRPRVKWFEPEVAKLQSDLDKAVGAGNAHILSVSRDNKRALVWYGVPASPGSYYVYDVDNGRMQRFAELGLGLPRERLGAVKPYRYTARDGLEINAYLTLPAKSSGRHLPLIIMPHGGPFGIRDDFGWDMHAQFLASRGYAVLQPNFRGSGGYGQEFYNRGVGQWGRAMQDDLDDGMDALVAAGVVDPKRVCIVGLSYGGYAALWGVTRNPERYRCAASFAGISDVRGMLRYDQRLMSNPRYADDWRARVRGDNDFNLAEVSPLQQLARLQRPVLLVHGGDDSNVPPGQSTGYADALKRAGKPFELQVYPGEGHGPTNAANRADWLARLEKFLAKYNPA